jgi:hypothetical protein
MEINPNLHQSFTWRDFLGNHPARSDSRRVLRTYICIRFTTFVNKLGAENLETALFSYFHRAAAAFPSFSRSSLIQDHFVRRAGHNTQA